VGKIYGKSSTFEDKYALQLQKLKSTAKPRGNKKISTEHVSIFYRLYYSIPGLLSCSCGAASFYDTFSSLFYTVFMQKKIKIAILMIFKRLPLISVIYSYEAKNMIVIPPLNVYDTTRGTLPVRLLVFELEGSSFFAI
jgi:hypothetical protein